MESVSRKKAKLQNPVNTEPLWRCTVYFPVSHIFCNRDGWVLSFTRVSGVPMWDYFINHHAKLAWQVGGERWALHPSFGRADGRQVSEQCTGTVPKAGSAGSGSSWQRPEERTAQEVKCRSPTSELWLWMSKFTSLWPQSEAAPWRRVLFSDRVTFSIKLRSRFVVCKTKRWGGGGTNTASSSKTLERCQICVECLLAPSHTQRDLLC